MTELILVPETNLLKLKSQNLLLQLLLPLNGLQHHRCHEKEVVPVHRGYHEAQVQLSSQADHTILHKAGQDLGGGNLLLFVTSVYFSEPFLKHINDTTTFK